MRTFILFCTSVVLKLKFKRCFGTHFTFTNLLKYSKYCISCTYWLYWKFGSIPHLRSAQHIPTKINPTEALLQEFAMHYIFTLSVFVTLHLRCVSCICIEHTHWFEFAWLLRMQLILANEGETVQEGVQQQRRWMAITGVLEGGYPSARYYIYIIHIKTLWLWYPKNCTKAHWTFPNRLRNAVFHSIPPNLIFYPNQISIGNQKSEIFILYLKWE